MSSSPIVAERSLRLVATPDVQVLEPYLRSLHSAVADLSQPLALERIAAVVCDAAKDALDVQALVIAVHDNGGSRLRASMPRACRTRSRDASARARSPRLSSSGRSTGSSAARSRSPPHVAALPISQGARTFGLLFSAGATTSRSPPTIARSSTC